MDGTSKPTSVNRQPVHVRLERGNLIFRDTGSFTTWRGSSTPVKSGSIAETCRGAHVSGGLSHRRPKTIVDQVPPASIRAAARDIACRAFYVHVLAVGTCAINGPVHHDLGDIAVNEHMARLGLQRQAEAEIALEFGSDLGAISDGSPVVRDEHGSVVQGLHRTDLAGVKSLNQRRDDAFGFSGERIGLGHRGLLSCWLNCDAASVGAEKQRQGGGRGGAENGRSVNGVSMPPMLVVCRRTAASRARPGERCADHQPCDPGDESLSPCQWRAHGLSTANTNFPRVWPATPRSNASRASVSGTVCAITGRTAPASINAAIWLSCSRSGRTMKNTPRLLSLPCAAASDSGIGSGKLTRMPPGFNTCQDRSRVPPPMVSRTTSISRTISSYRTSRYSSTSFAPRPSRKSRFAADAVPITYAPCQRAI